MRIDTESIDKLLDYLSKMFEEDQYDPRSPLHQAAFLISINQDVHRTILRNRVGILQEDEGIR